MSISLLKRFLKQPVTIVGIITALLFQVFFSLIWVTGYDHVSDRVNQMSIAIVNEDGTAAQPIIDGISSSLKFRLETDLTLQEAKDAMNRRDIRMIINIPQGFTKQLSNPEEQAELDYLINQSNPQMVSNAMQTVAAQITAALNKQTTVRGLQQALEAMQIPAAQADILKSGISSRIHANVKITNPATNFAQTMVPLMIVTASFTGSMLLAMNLNRASIVLSSQAGKWQRFAARFIIMGTVAFLASLISTTLINSLGIPFTTGYFATWMFEFLIILACMTVAQLSLVLFGDAGAWMNIGLLSIQMLSSGATIPREILSPFYVWIGQFFPARYAVDGMLDLVIGGQGIRHDVLALVYIAIACTLLSALVTVVRRAPKKIPVEAASPASS
ncbi:YhgE/Pip domain-containing protein [Paenibacillus sp. P46E]|uniref:YhgE/Pip domain-containing protein n=1 Tax=Paenibacillus sp. P46E TaxID=1349436 RepID=UPI00093CF44D|nr:ABC transporter permease [Paenibacillus sp. P46E]OKP97646.1 hypothetical protein A3849_14890 [Paenibacillus sp. P46E]